MIPEVGQFALVLAMCLTLAQAFFAFAGVQTGRADWMAIVRPAATGQFVFVVAAFACLTSAFLDSDFSVLYVAANSNTSLPTMYRIAAVWGAHEGSMLLWILILSFWTLAVCVFSRGLPETFAARALGVLGLLSIGFIVFVLATSNPFDRLFPVQLEGRDLNPLLQDPAMAIHPPILYTGYVGFAVPFAFAIAAMLEGRLDHDWARWSRPWTLVAWLFLTVGIALGSWWAYYELGWGGWWFWDPVENASFMPWLAGLALIHSLAVTESRGLFKSWTLLLAITAFSLSLLGTFLVRSGVLVSVHAFASDPRRGVFILLFLAVCIGGALLIYALRAPRMTSKAGFDPVSRESFILFNNVLLVIATSLILLGTLYPLFLDALNLGKISVGPPYFETVFIIPMLPLVMLLGFGMHTAWTHARAGSIWGRLQNVAIISAVIAVAVPWLVYGRTTLLVALGVFAGTWAMLSSLIQPVTIFRAQKSVAAIPRGLLGMSLAHFGVGVFVIGATIVSAYEVKRDASPAVGETVSVAGYDVRFAGIQDITGPNYGGVEATLEVSRNGEIVTVLRPQKRVYRVQQNPMTEAAIDMAPGRDLKVAIGDPVGNNAWSMRIQYQPMVRLIWLGALLMALGAGLAASDKRYRRQRAKQREAARDAAVAGETA